MDEKDPGRVLYMRLEAGFDVVGGRILSRKSLCKGDPPGTGVRPGRWEEAGGRITRGEAGTVVQKTRENGAMRMQMRVQIQVRV